MGLKSKVFVLTCILGFYASPPAAAMSAVVNCPAGGDLNQCVAQACQNPKGATVRLQAGQYQANLGTALNVVNSFPAPFPQGTGLCQGGVSIIGKGAHKTILVADSPNPNPNPNAPAPLPFTVAIGSPNGAMGSVTIRDLTVRCTTPGACSQYGISVFNAESATVSGIFVDGFVRGILVAGSDFSLKGNHLRGVGVDNFGGRGIFAAHPFGALEGRQSNLSVSQNVLEDYFRGIVVDSTDGVRVTDNALLGMPQAIFAQNNDGRMEISRNLIHDTDVGIFAGLGLFDLETFEGYGNTQNARLSHNLILGARVGIALNFDPNFEADPIVSHNVLLDVEAALGFDVDITPPNLPPPPPEESYDPCLHEVAWKHNLVLPPSAIPDLGNCE